MKHSTLVDAFDAARKTNLGITFIEGEHNELKVGYAQVYERALVLLHHFQARGIGPGSEMILLLTSNARFVDAFWACQLGGIVAVPIAVGINEEQRRRLLHVAQRLSNPFLCTHEKTFERYRTFADEMGLGAVAEKLAARAVFVDHVAETGKGGTRHEPQPDDVAVIQFSSGSTSSPKGVQLTHRNITTNIDAMLLGIHAVPQDAMLSWMPLTHDMGLIGSHLMPLSMPFSQCLMSTEVFVRRPLLWIRKASEKRATVLGSPNFGYRHFLRAFDHAKSDGIDLSAVRLICNGAEPISPDICNEFTAALAPHSLKATSMFPVYGLAEASLAVTVPDPGKGIDVVYLHRDSLMIGSAARLSDAADPKALALVKVGRAVKHIELRVRDDHGAVMETGVVGHIQIRGDNVTIGYYAGTRGDGVDFTEDGWLDTGDVGFMHEGELVITGRAKDIIFSGGQNHFPQDLEALLEGIPEVGLGKAVVCTVRPADAPADEVVAFLLHRGPLEEFVPIARAARACVSEGAGLELRRVVPVRQISKTTSGKVQRFLLRDGYLAGDFDAAIAGLAALEPHSSAAEQHAVGAIERQLLEIAQKFIPDREIGVNDNIHELGTSSLVLIEIYEQIDKNWPNRLEITDFRDYPTIAKLARHLESAANQPVMA